MYLKLAKRALFETDKRLLWKFARNMGWGGVRSVQKFKRRLKRGEFFPPFLYVSIINSCNLRCQGCWVDVAAKQQTIDLDAIFSSGYSFLIEMAFYCQRAGFRVGEVPIIFVNRTEGVSKISRSEIYKAMYTLLRLRTSALPWEQMVGLYERRRKRVTIDDVR